MSSPLTFDSETVLAFFLGEVAGARVRDLFDEVRNGKAIGYINVVNLTEVYYILSRLSPAVAEEKQRILRAYGLKVVPVEDDGLWREAAKIKCDHSLSLADAFAVATAKKFMSRLVVGRDKEFDNVGADVLKMR